MQSARRAGGAAFFHFMCTHLFPTIQKTKPGIPQNYHIFTAQITEDGFLLQKRTRTNHKLKIRIYRAADHCQMP